MIQQAHINTVICCFTDKVGKPLSMILFVRKNTDYWLEQADCTGTFGFNCCILWIFALFAQLCKCIWRAKARFLYSFVLYKCIYGLIDFVIWGLCFHQKKVKITFLCHMYKYYMFILVKMPREFHQVLDCPILFFIDIYGTCISLL